MIDRAFIPERLKEIREERNLIKATIVFMAQKLGTSPEYLTGEEDTPEPREYIISKTDDPELFALIQDILDTKNPTRTRLLAYYKKLKADPKK